MPHVAKIQRVLEALGYKETDLIRFKLKRFEKLNRTNVNLEAKDADDLKERYRLFTERYDLRILDDDFPSVSGTMELKEFISFLRDYDEKFNLNWCEIDFKEITIKPAYL